MASVYGFTASWTDDTSGEIPDVEMMPLLGDMCETLYSGEDYNTAWQQCLVTGYCLLTFDWASVRPTSGSGKLLVSDMSDIKQKTILLLLNIDLFKSLPSRHHHRLIKLARRSPFFNVNDAQELNYVKQKYDVSDSLSEYLIQCYRMIERVISWNLTLTKDSGDAMKKY